MASADVCEVQPLKAFLSTNLNNKNKTFDDVANRIMRNLGWPAMSVELHRDQVYDAIAFAIELFTRYAGYEENYLVFDSKLYERDKGIRIDKLCTIASNKAAILANIKPRVINQTYDHTLELPDRVYVSTRDIPLKELPSTWNEPIHNLQILTAEEYDEVTTYNSALCAYFKIDADDKFTMEGEVMKDQPKYFEHAFDYDLMDYRKVAEVISYDESSNRNITSLFSFESALASQAYYQYQFTLKGFDLLSFHTLHEFLKTRDRTLALNRSFYFDPKTQYFTLMPQPRPEQGFYGILEVRIERALRDIIGEPWVFKYALAQCQVMLGTIRGRYGQVQLAGGGTFADNINLRNSGETTMKELEKELMEGTAFSAKKYPLFFVG